MNSDLQPFFTPRSIAVVGASRDPRKLGCVILDNLLRGRFPGEVFAVNKAAETVLGRPAFSTVSAIKAPVDLAVVVVPASAVKDVIRDCAQANVPAALIITAGFRELGAEGLAREQAVAASAQCAGIRVIGPNSVGIINTFASLNATFAEAQPLRFEVSLISQSGAVATAILDWARELGLGFSKFVSLGNASDVTEVELLDYMGQDAETRVIVMYLEGFSDGRSFIEACRRVTEHKPLIVMKVGRSTAGSRAAASHTGAIASADIVVDAALRQGGAVRAYTLDELFDYTLAFSYARLPQGPRVAVVTNAGGPGVMAADAIERSGLKVATLSNATTSALKEVLPPSASLSNPVDILGDARSSRYQRALPPVLQDSNVDAIIVMLTPQAVTEVEQTARTIAHLARTGDKPLVAVFMGGLAVARGREMLDQSGVATFAYPERAVRALRALWTYADFRHGDNQA